MSSFRSPTYRLLCRLIASIVCHCKEHDKVPYGDLFYMWCLNQTEFHLNLPFSLALYFYGMPLGTMPSSKICGGHWVTRLALSYKDDTSGMAPIPVRDMGTTALGKIWVLVRGDDR